MHNLRLNACLNFCDVKVIRLMQLHIWLKDYCFTRNIVYVNNTTTDPYKHDCLHPNHVGSLSLSPKCQTHTSLFTNSHVTESR